MTKEYGADSIVELKFPHTVREKVGMYLGDGGQRGFFHTLTEILDNSVDEFVAGYGNKIEIKIDSKINKVTIRDYGRGIPFETNSNGVSALILAMTTLHAGGKHRQMGNSAYKYSSGINGVGASVVNGVSDLFHVKSIKGDKIATITWNNGEIALPLTVSNNVDGIENGTLVEWIPSVKTSEFDNVGVFEQGCKFDKDEVIQKLKYIPFLNLGLSIHLTYDDEVFYFNEEKIKENILQLNNQTLLIENSAFYEEEWVLLQNKGGGTTRPMLLNEFLNLSENERKNYENEIKTSLISLAFNFTTKPQPLQLHFANGVQISGGKPDQSFKMQMRNIFNEFVHEMKISKNNFETEDIFHVLTFMLSVKINQPSFAGQTKDKLNNPESAIMTTSFMKKNLYHWIHRLPNNELKKIVDIIEEVSKAREKMTQIQSDSYKSISNLTGAEILNNKGKLDDCYSNDRERNELFIVEGDSASGPIKQTRCIKHQAFLPLRGKILNVIKKGNQSKIFDNKEVLSLAYALGGIGKDFDINKCKYSKIIILADADLDGYHITSLMLTFFYQFYKELIINGNIYVGQAPLFKIVGNFSVKENKEIFLQKYQGIEKNVLWALNEEELKDILDNIEGNFSIGRNKGLGEMQADDLFATTLNPQRRKLLQISMDNFEEANLKMNVFMNDEKDGKTALKDIINKYYKNNKKPIIKLTSPENKEGI